ncbi:Fatty acid desaturase [Polystyrenella longa]|uniref:Fatty acid desaturase n=1 Tax=Polystyrenella longa TaxID=2528007 RepID=A0A518CIQ8_9PLAN|nr:fatty acid desaturase [Polystyrenella longa]QDU79100.1 Fatty acid desaturase [Polystyrenella longa]
MATELVEPGVPVEETESVNGNQAVAMAGGSGEALPIWDSFLPTHLSWANVDWAVFMWMSAMHIGFLAAPFFFTWEAGVVALVMHFLCSSCGICIGFHRYLSHRSFQLKKPAEAFMLTCAVLAGQGSPLKWAATHRLHHQRSDKEGDPHSPQDGKWWSHLTWLFMSQPPEAIEALYKKYIPDLLKKPIMRFLEKTYGPILLLTAPAFFAAGYVYGGVTQGLAFMLWGLCFRIVVSYHSTWCVNSATHLWGYISYKTTDTSKNNWWVALLTYGEGWHNNHHAHPRLARAGHRWWEIDISFWVIRLMQMMGQATQVVDKIPTQGAQSTEHEL